MEGNTVQTLTQEKKGLPQKTPSTQVIPVLQKNKVSGLHYIVKTNIIIFCFHIILGANDPLHIVYALVSIIEYVT